MKHGRSTTIAVALALGVSAATAKGVQAAPLALLAPQLVNHLAFPALQDCAPSIGRSAPSALRTAPESSKNSAILGGQASRLEMVSLQQSAMVGAALRPATLRTDKSHELTAGSVQTCRVSFGMPRSPDSPQVGAGSGAFLGSKLVQIGRSPFDRNWARVGSDGLSRRIAVRAIQFTESGVNVETLAKVNAWTNARVRYVDDEKLYRQADYWASARDTLRKRAGDCEDIAIVKMQLLAALGVRRSDMYLTVARDLVRNADHAMLVVKIDNLMWLLDNSTAKIQDASQNNDYRPILSYNGNGKWLHGY